MVSENNLKVPLKGENPNFDSSDSLSQSSSSKFQKSGKLQIFGLISGGVVILAACVVLTFSFSSSTNGFMGSSSSSGNPLSSSSSSESTNSQPQVWPLPAAFSEPTTFFYVDPTNFFITTTSPSSILSAAVNRYSFQDWIFNKNDLEFRNSGKLNQSTPIGPNYVQFLRVSVRNDSDALFLGVDESYTITIGSPVSTIVAPTVYGAVRGLETFAQLVTQPSLKKSESSQSRNYTIPAVTISDGPRFKFRGLLVDVARHYLNITRLHDILKSMVIQKLNIMLLHLTDDQSFPFASQSHPNLTRTLGPGQFYTHDDFRWLNQRAKEYGVMIQVELDLPAHASSWGGEPDLLICSGKPGSGLINPLPAYTYETLNDLYQEFVNLFDSAIIHLGGDEVERDCWQNSPQIVDFAQKNGYEVAGWDCPNTTICSIECYFHYHQAQAAIDAGFKHLFMWEDVRGCKALQTLDSVAVIDVWDQDAPETWYESGVPSAIQHGFTEVVVSSGCYFLKYSPPWATGTWTWKNNYACDVQNVSSLTPPQLDMIIGGHASRWGEGSDNNNWFNTTYPSLAGVAEKLWTPANLTLPTAQNLNAATPRVMLMLCRMSRLNLGPFDSEYGPWPFTWC